jgi:AraC family transcriptional regulator
MTQQLNASTEQRRNLANGSFDLYAETVEVGLPHEVAWRQPTTLGENREYLLEVWRWADPRTVERHEVSDTPVDCHIISVALKAARLALATDSKVLFEGLMPPGMLYISGPSERIVAQFYTPCDFLHVYVGNGVLREGRLLSKDTGQSAVVERRPYRDRLVELLSQSLLDADNPCHRSYAESIGRTIAMRAMGQRLPEKCVTSLPKWRLKKLKQYIELNIEKSIGLQDMADAVGLSRMHFAAQFRIATGLRPHEYLLLQRIERAKCVMAETETPLVEVALSVGFQAQAHFSTVFKRFIGKSPAQWRREQQFDLAPIGMAHAWPGIAEPAYS